MGVGGQCHVPATLASGKTWYPLYRRLGGPQGQSGWMQKISPPTVFDPQIVQPVVSRWTDWAIPAHIVSYPFHKFQSSGILSSTWLFLFCYIFSKPPSHWYHTGLPAFINQTDILSSPAGFPCANLLIVISKCNILFLPITLSQEPHAVFLRHLLEINITAHTTMNYAEWWKKDQ
jgi:hypothetical protein